MHFSRGAIFFRLVELLIAFVNGCFSVFQTFVPRFGDAQLTLFQMFMVSKMHFGPLFYKVPGTIFDTKACQILSARLIFRQTNKNKQRVSSRLNNCIGI
jgi:hypothetical protein